MCFGQMDTTRRDTTTQNLPAYLESAAQQNIGLASSYAAKPFEAYTAPRVAGLSDNESDAFGLVKSIAGSSNPYLSDIEGLYGRFADSPAQSVSAPSIIGPNTDVRTSSIQDYMTPYLQQILAPMLQDIERKGVADRKTLDAQATMDGAYGDTRSGIERAEQRRNEDVLRSNTIGTQSANAFNNALQTRGTDIANLMDSQKTNANFMEQFLQRAITGGKALQDLDASQVDRGLKTADALAKAGATERGIEQAKLDTNFAEFLRQQGWDAEKIKTFTSALSGTPYSKEQTTTREEPNNTGFQLASSLFGAILSDRRMKYDIAAIGQTYDGQTIYRFKYVGDDSTVHIGLMAQDVEKVCPQAVTEIDGAKVVNYGIATQTAASMGEG